MAKTVVEELDEAQQALAGQAAAHAEQVSALEAQVDALTEQVNQAAAEQAAALNLATEATQERDKVAGELAAERAAHEVTRGELAAAKQELAQVLANPAFAAAAKAGLKSATAEGGSLEAGEGMFETREAALAAYRQIPDTDAETRREFRAQHKEILGL